MLAKCTVTFVGGCLALVVSGCGSLGFLGSDDGQPTGRAGQVAAKAINVASQIGGDDGFGGELMDSYFSHMEDHMGFHGDSDLADPDQEMMVEFHNESDQDCTFSLTYAASHMGIDDQAMDIDVQAGETVTIALTCAEIIGLGSLTVIGETAAELADGTMLDNVMSVPAFLGSDYECDGTYACTLMVDSDDLDGDGDTQELIVVTDGLPLHMGPSGMGGHLHGGMMGGGI